MSFRPSPRQTLALWKMLFSDEEPKQSDFADFLGKNGARAREELVKAGFIQLEKRGRAKYVLLTDHAWAWASENLDAEVSLSKYATPVLVALLGKLKAFMESNNVVLAEVLRQPEQAVPKGDGSETTDPIRFRADGFVSDELIERAYYQVSRGKANARVRLAALRELLPGISKDTLDSLLLSMQSKGKLVLYSLDDPREIGPADDAAAVDVGGFKRHIVYMGG